ncbi:hypothetical protein IT570_05785 [Candidatus Sumerlaeota bacterium]|nr:hypothetical protein [Candidatus Sumerlaeota bacterium]
MRKVHLFAAALAVAAVSPVFAQSFNFDTDQSASFTTTIASSTNDAAANYNYDYSTHVQFNGPAVTIPTAPNSTGGTTRGVRLAANTINVGDTTDVDAVAIYPTVAPPVGSNWEMVFDTWINYNGPAAGGSGSTQGIIFGAADTTAVQPKLSAGPITGTGFYFSLMAEGGASQDYRFYNGTSSIAASTTTAGISWFGFPGTDSVAAAYNHLNSNWQTFFAAPADLPPGVFETAGAPGKQWITVKMSVAGSNVTIGIKRPGDTTFTTVGTATVVTGAVQPFVGYSDINTGQASPIGDFNDQFAVFDNLSVQVVSDASGWTIYN